MKYFVNFFEKNIFIDIYNKNGDFVTTYKTARLPEGDTARENVIDTFRYIAYKKELGEF